MKENEGKQQQITIRSSGGLSDADIDRMVQEAEAAKEKANEVMWAVFAAFIK